MAWRDSRRSRRRLLLYSSAIVLGVAALVAVASLGDNLQGAIEDQSKALLGADLSITSNGGFSAEELELVKSLGGRQVREISFSSMAYFPRADGTRLVNVKALEEGYPFYGSLETTPPQAAKAFQREPGALIDGTVMRQFRLQVGDEVKLGEATFPIRGSLQRAPGEVAAFSTLAPRVYIPFTELEKTGLLGKGSLVRHRVYFQFGPEVDVSRMVRKFRPQIARFHWDADTVEERKRELGRAMTNLYHFLNLVGFVALLLGGVGVASAIHVHVKQKLPTVAILRSLGCRGSQAFAVYLVQGAALGFLGVLGGAAIGVGVQKAMPWILSDFIPFQFKAAVSWPALARGAGVGMLMCLLFALLPLLMVRRVAPLAVLRASVEQTRVGQRDPWVWTIYALIAAGVVWFSISQSREWQHGLAFAGSVGLAFVLLTGVAKLAAVGLRRQVSRVRRFTWRQGLASLYRPENRTVLLVVTLGLGTFLILTLYLVQGNLVREILPSSSENRPDTVLFDVQPDQRDGVVDLLRQQGLTVLQDVPVVSMRLAEVKGRSVERLRRDPRRPVPGWALRREYRSTYRGELVGSEKLIAGTLRERVPPETSPIPVSVEEGIAKTLGVGLGDELVFDVQGVPVRTQVASLREVEWRRLQPNFFVVFPLGVLEDAPSFHVMVTRTGSSERSAQLQRELVKKFANVSTVDLSLILQTVESILGKVSAVVRFMALFTVGTGVIVLAMSILSGRYQRLQESILLRTLGASRRQILQIMAVEYLCLGSLAAATGILLSVVGSWAFSVWIFKVPYSIPAGALFLAWAVVSALTVAVGLLTSRGICNHPPLEILRSES